VIVQSATGGAPVLGVSTGQNCVITARRR